MFIPKKILMVSAVMAFAQLANAQAIDPAVETSGSSAAGYSVTEVKPVPSGLSAGELANDPFIKARESRAAARSDYKEQKGAARQEYKSEVKQTNAEMRDALRQSDNASGSSGNAPAGRDNIRSGE